MLLLLDAHVPLSVAAELRKRGPDVETLEDWRDGDYRHSPDSEILLAAHSEGRVLVSYECRTIPRRLKDWAASGVHHSGVVLIDDRTIRSDDVGGLVRAIYALSVERGDATGPTKSSS